MSQRALQAVLSLCFCLIIAMPLTGMLFHIGTLTHNEFQIQNNRPPAGYPTNISLRDWPEKLGAWFNDSFAFRDTLINAHARIENRIWNRSGFPKLVQKGRDGYLFLGDNYAETFKHHAGLPIWDATTLTKALHNEQRIQAWFANRGIPVLTVIAPDKASVYPEKLPEWVQAPNQHLLSRALISAMRTANLPVPVYPLDDLLAAKQLFSADIYFKTDTHWTLLGAYVAYQNIMRELNTRFNLNLKTLPQPEYSLLPHEQAMDLDTFLRDKGANTFVKLEDKDWPVPLQDTVSLSTPVALPKQFQKMQNQGKIQSTPEAPNAQRILLVGDSFADFLYAPLTRSFKEALFCHNDVPEAILAQYIVNFKPQLVVLEMVERNTPLFLPNRLHSIHTQPLLPEELAGISTSGVEQALTPQAIVKLDRINGSMTLHDSEAVLTATTNDPQLLLSPLPDNLNSVLLELDVTLPEDTLVQLFVASTEPKIFEEAYSTKVAGKKGRNKLMLLYTSPKPITGLRLDPGAVPGAYRFHSIKLRPFSAPTDPAELKKRLNKFYSTL